MAIRAGQVFKPQFPDGLAIFSMRAQEPDPGKLPMTSIVQAFVVLLCVVQSKSSDGLLRLPSIIMACQPYSEDRCRYIMLA